MDFLPLFAILALFLLVSVMLFATAKSGTPQREPQAAPPVVQNGESMQLTIPVAPTDAPAEAEASDVGGAETDAAGDDASGPADDSAEGEAPPVEGGDG